MSSRDAFAWQEGEVGPRGTSYSPRAQPVVPALGGPCRPRPACRASRDSGTGRPDVPAEPNAGLADEPGGSLDAAGAGRWAHPAAIVRTWSRVRLSDMRCTNVPSRSSSTCAWPQRAGLVFISIPSRVTVSQSSPGAQLAIWVAPAGWELTKRDAFVSVGRVVDDADLHR